MLSSDAALADIGVGGEPLEEDPVFLPVETFFLTFSAAALIDGAVSDVIAFALGLDTETVFSFCTVLSGPAFFVSGLVVSGRLVVGLSDFLNADVTKSFTAFPKF